MYVTLIVPVLLPFFVISFGHPHTHSKSGSKMKTVVLYNDKHFKGFPRYFTYDSSVSNCKNYDGVDESPSPASSAKLVNGGCVRLCDLPCNYYKYEVNGPMCVELTRDKPLGAFPGRLNDKIKSFSDCPSRNHQHRLLAQEEEPYYSK